MAQVETDIIDTIATVYSLQTRCHLVLGFQSTVEWTTLRIRNMTFGILPVGVVMCVLAVEYDEVAFSDLSVAVPWQERLVH